MLDITNGGPPPISGWRYNERLKVWFKEYHLGGETFIYVWQGKWETHSYRRDKSYWEWMLTDTHNTLQAAITAADNYTHNRTNTR